jgi:ATP-dependent exoDNAse (exonuclease V) alpha subunit
MVTEHYADLVAKDLSPGGIRVLSPHNTGTDGTRAVNIEVRKELEFPPDALVVGDILLITENDYQAACCAGYPQISQEEDGCETIFNGELCEIINVGSDFIDVKFEENCDGVRHVRLILSDGLDAASRLPDGVAFGRAMSVHKGQGSQFPAVIFPTETGNKRFGIIQKSIVYTALSRGIDMVIIIGDFDDFVHAALTPDLPRNTLLRDLLIEGSGRGAKS